MLSLFEVVTTRLVGCHQYNIKRMNSDFCFLTFIFLFPHFYYLLNNSKKLHPIKLSDNVDTYLNYVFYIKGLELPIIPVIEPSYPPIPQRGEVTVVDVSEIVE